MNDIKKLFGQKLKYVREQKGYTQEKFAEKIDISSRALSSIECGKNFVSSDTLQKICVALQINPKVLFDFDFPYMAAEDMKKELLTIIDKNEEHLAVIYKIIKSYLQ